MAYAKYVWKVICIFILNFHALLRLLLEILQKTTKNTKSFRIKLLWKRLFMPSFSGVVTLSRSTVVIRRIKYIGLESEPEPIYDDKSSLLITDSPPDKNNT